MATAKQKQIAKKNRDNAVKAMKKAKKGSAAHKAAQAKVAALSKIMKSKTTATATTSGSTKLALAKVARDTAKVTRTAAVKKMQDLKPGSEAWKKARRNVVTASSNVRKQGNIMRDVSGRAMGERTSYTGPSQSMRQYIQSIEASKGGKALTKLADPTKWSQLNQQMLNEMPGDTYAQKRAAWDDAWGDPGSDSYKNMQQIQAERFKTAYPDADPDVDTIVDGPGTGGPGTGGPGTGGPGTGGPGTGGPGTFTADIPGSVPRLYSGNIPGRMAAGGGYPSGFLSPAQDAAQGWAGQLGFNIDPRGGLMLRPWEAQSWQLAGIDPRLWNPGTGGVLPPGGGGGGGGGGFVPPGGGGGTVGPKYPGVPPGSQQERDRDAGRIHHPEMYNPDGSWVGAEGTEGGGGRREGPTISQGSGGQVSLPGGGGRGWVNPNTGSSNGLLAGPYVGPISHQVAPSQNYGGINPFTGVNIMAPVDDFSNIPAVAPGVNTRAYTSSLDDSQMRAWNSMTPAQQQSAARTFNQQIGYSGGFMGGYGDYGSGESAAEIQADIDFARDTGGLVD